ncbi:DUF3304 domain-containing protein [Pseudomonas glycinae]|uniref:DUF3304 domain-containing protein n=1 Tax=Candidatus Pseudomonas auctus TaxID=3461260 RepID=UPI003B906301
MTVAMNMKRQKIWRRRNLVIGLLVLLLPFLGSYLYNQFRTPGAMLTSANYMDRPIFSFWANDFWGGNLMAMGGGGIMCCTRFEGKTIKIKWILDMTRQQQLSGAVEEHHEIELPLPERGPTDQYLHVQFEPGNKVRLGWSPDLTRPFPSPFAKQKSIEQGRIP